MWKDFDGTDYSREEFAAHIATLKWNQGWKPQGITLHNTAAPTLAQWVESGDKHKQRIANLQSYYEGMGWHSGPHLFISRNHITGFANILKPGIHSRCFNATHIGIECVGDYNTEPWDVGDGALVRDNAVFALATLFKAIGMSPATLVFHKECKLDNHDCPGHLVSKPDMIDRVIRAMFVQGPLAEAKAAVPVEPWDQIDWPIPSNGTYRMAWIQDALNRLSPPALAIRVDGIAGEETKYAIRRFQHEQNLHIDGIAGPITVAVIKDMLNLKGLPL